MELRDKIDAYVKGQLAEPDRQAFEREIEADPALAEAVALARLDLDVADLLIEDDLRGWMQGWQAEERTAAVSVPPAMPATPPRELVVTTNNTRRPARAWFAAAAAVALLIAAVWWLNREPVAPTGPELVDNGATPTPEEQQPVYRDSQYTESPGSPLPPPEKPRPAPRAVPDRRYLALAETSFRRDPATVSRKGEPAGNPSADPLRQAAALMAEKNYRTAAERLSALPADDRQFLSAQVLLGQACFFLGNYPRAEQAYARVLAAPDRISPTAVEWNLLMTYLAQYPAKKAAFDALLEKILADPDHPDYDDAVKLREAVK